MSNMPTYRSRIRQIVPRWLRGSVAYRWLYAFAVMLDGLVDALVAAIKIRFPGLLPDTGQLALLGSDRKLTRAPAESDAAYAERLRLWRQAHQHRGSAYELLRQLRIYCQPFTFVMQVISHDAVYNQASNGDQSWTTATWDWDGENIAHRFWVILYPPDAFITDEGLWGDTDSVFGEPGTIGSSAPFDLVEGIRSLVLDWDSAHGYCSNVIVVLDEGAWASQQPNGTWQLWGNRNPAAVYWDSPTPERR